MRKKTAYVNMPSIIAVHSATVIPFKAESGALFTEFAAVNFLTPENSLEMNSWIDQM